MTARLRIGAVVTICAGALAVGTSLTPAVGAGATAGPGGLYSFGLNQYGQLGNLANIGTVAANPAPQLVTLPPAAGTVTQAAVGSEHSLIVTSSGKAYAFGDYQYGQLGTNAILTGALPPDASPSPIAVAVPASSGAVTEVSAGFDHSLVLTASGRVYSFGLNSSGQLGVVSNSGTTNSNPTPLEVPLPGLVHSAGAGGIRVRRTPVITAPLINGAIRIAAGGSHSLVVTHNGRLYAFGDDSYGQLGTQPAGPPTANPVLTPVTLPGEVGTVSEIAAGAGHNLVVTSSGQLYSFGDNSNGQLGTPANSGTVTPNPTPTLVTLPGAVGTVAKIAAGAGHSLVVTSSGQLYAFGDNTFGQLGIATGLNSGTVNAHPTPTLVRLPGEIGTVTQVAAGADDSLVVTSSGQLYAFGGNSSGQLGIIAGAGGAGANPTPALVSLPAGTTIETIAAGVGAHSLAVVSDLAVSSARLPSGQVGSAFAATLTASGGVPPYRWSSTGLPAGLALDASNGMVSGTPAAAGVASVKVTVGDADGIEASSSLTLTVTAGAGTTTTPTAAPTITALAQSHARWRERIATHRRAPLGTTFSFTLDQAAHVRLAFTQLLPGRRVKGHCVARSAANRSRPVCVRKRGRGTITFAGHAGADTFAFKGRLNGATTLHPGRYVLAVTATNPAGQRSAPLTLAFTISR